MVPNDRPWVVKRLEWGAWTLGYTNASGEKFLYPMNKSLEVIGNIYENPDFLLGT